MGRPASPSTWGADLPRSTSPFRPSHSTAQCKRLRQPSPPSRYGTTRPTTRCHPNPPYTPVATPFHHPTFPHTTPAPPLWNYSPDIQISSPNNCASPPPPPLSARGRRRLEWGGPLRLLRICPNFPSQPTLWREGPPRACPTGEPQPSLPLSLLPALSPFLPPSLPLTLSFPRSLARSPSSRARSLARSLAPSILASSLARSLALFLPPALLSHTTHPAFSRSVRAQGEWHSAAHGLLR